MKSNCLPAAFTKRPSPTTVRLRRLVDDQQRIEIGLRVKELRDNSAETSRSIADYCEVSVEAVRNWIAGKGISYDNAQKVADLFERDVDWVWRGRTKRTEGSPFDSLSAPASSADLARVEENLLGKIDRLAEQVGKLQAQQTKLLAELARERRSQPGQQRKQKRSG